MPCFLPKSEESMVLPIRNLKNSTRQGSSDIELHCTGVIISVIWRKKSSLLVGVLLSEVRGQHPALPCHRFR